MVSTDRIPRATIYELVNETEKLRYIGSTRKRLLSSRLAEHRCDSTRYNCGSRLLFNSGLQDVQIKELKVLEDVTPEELRYEEWRHIQMAKDDSFLLCNRYGKSSIPFGLSKSEYGKAYRARLKEKMAGLNIPDSVVN